MAPLDIAIVIVYLVAIVGLGCWAGLRARLKSGDADQAKRYFLAGGTLKWPVIGLALFATNISTVHLVGLSEAGFKTGLLMGNFELLAGFTLIILAIFFAPFIFAPSGDVAGLSRKAVFPAVAHIVAVLSVFSAIFIHIGFSLYTGAIVFNGIFGVELPKAVCVLAIALLTSIYTIAGGLTAVVITESFQTLVLLTGAITITLIGWFRVGGWHGVATNVPEINLTLFRRASDPGDCPGIHLSWAIRSLAFGTGAPTRPSCSVCSTHDEIHARAGTLFAGFIKILPLFIFVLPAPCATP